MNTTRGIRRFGTCPTRIAKEKMQKVTRHPAIETASELQQILLAQARPKDKLALYC